MTTAALLGACVLNYSFGQERTGTYPHMDCGPRWEGMGGLSRDWTHNKGFYRFGDWVDSVREDTSLECLRYPAAPVYLPQSFSVTPEGVCLTFSEPPDRECAEEEESDFREREAAALREEVTAWVEGDENASEAPEWFVEGRESYDMSCMACHQPGGVGDSMADSRWAGESPEVLARILLQGMEGPSGLMTSFDWMDDDELAAIISYIRVRWHDSGPVSADTLRRIREETEDRTDFWTEEELRALVEES